MESPRAGCGASACHEVEELPRWSINPYVGCEFGCTYCYARDTHRYATERAVGRTGGRAEGDPELAPWLAFEKRILVKTDIAERLARTLDPSKLGDDSLVIGTATDPYQPAERRYRLTRSILRGPHPLPGAPDRDHLQIAAGDA